MRTTFLLLLGLIPAFQDDPEAGPTIAELRRLGSDDPRERKAVLDLLRDDTAAEKDLVKALGNGATARRAAYRLGYRGDPRALPELKRALGSRHPEERAAALEILRRLPPEPECIGASLKSDDYSVALAAARAAWTHRGHRETAELAASAAREIEGERIRSLVHYRRLLAASLAAGGDDPFDGFERHLAMVEKVPALGAEYVLAVFQHDALLGNAKVVAGIRAMKDLPAAALEQARRAILESKFPVPADFASAWGSKSAALAEAASRRLGPAGLRHENVEGWVDLLKAGVLAPELEARVLEWLPRITGRAATGNRARDLGAWGTWARAIGKGGAGGAVDAAIDKGAAWLKENGIYSAERSLRGLITLESYALFKSGVGPSDPVLKRKLDALRSGPPVEIYDAALRVILFAELLPYERPKPGETVTEDAARERLKSLVGILVRAQKKSGGWGYDFNETSDDPNAYWDFSNTQFALLGLRAGANAGFDVPKSTWERAEKLLVRELRTDRSPEEAGDGAVASGPPAKAWGYNDEAGRTDPRWNLTCGGLSGLLICRASLSGKDPSEHLRDADVAAALRWMEGRYPLQMGPRGRMDLYGLWSMERACLIPGRPKLAGRDWYDEGSRRLLETQHEDGRWEGWGFGINAGEKFRSVETCLALLFLRRAFVPVATPSVPRAPAPTPAPAPPPKEKE